MPPGGICTRAHGPALMPAPRRRSLENHHAPLSIASKVFFRVPPLLRPQYRPWYIQPALYIATPQEEEKMRLLCTKTVGHRITLNTPNPFPIQ